MAAGMAALDLLKTPGVWDKMEQASDRLASGIGAAAKSAGIPIQQTRVGTMFTTFFSQTEPKDWNTVKVADKALFGKYFQKMLANGIYLAPSQFEAGFTSIIHDETIIEKTITAATEAFRTW